MTRLRVGVVGAGTVAQLQHIPNLLALGSLFELRGVADPSRTAREHVTALHGIPGFATPEALMDAGLDAVLIASPDALHFEQVQGALARGLHVFCEKPLCYASEDIRALIAARDAAGRVLQVGYMKRFDPAYRLALERLPGDAGTLRQVAVEVVDPDAWPFVAHRDLRRGDDIPADLVEAVAERQRDQVARAVGQPLSGTDFRGFTGAYCSALIHDVNAVHGLLDALGVTGGEIIGAAFYAGGDGGQGSLRLLDGRAVWTMSHLTVPGLAHYRVRIALIFDDAILELVFPSPWLNHHPTRLTLRTSDGLTELATRLRPGYGAAFVEELRGFYAAIAGEAPVLNPPEEALRDQMLVCGLARHALGASVSR